LDMSKRPNSDIAIIGMISNVCFRLISIFISVI
jgi:hypothetical protein